MPLSTLPFVKDENAWAPQRTGNYEKDCATGRAYGKALIDFIRERESPQVFGHIARAMTAGGVFEGVEVGFCSAIGIHIQVAQ